MDISRIFSLIKIILFGLSVLLALVYSLSILLIFRFRHRLNMLTVNICTAMLCSYIYWTAYFTMWEYYIDKLFTLMTCTFLFYIQFISICIIPFSFVILTINRFCVIIYSTNTFFKTKKFLILCISSQWITACLLALPYVLNIEPVNFFLKVYICVSDS